MALDEGQVARVVIPFGGVVRHPSAGLSYIVESGIPKFHDLELRDEVWPHWMAMARDSLANALAARERNPGYSVEGETAFGEALQLEMRSSMAAICNAAFSLEAFTSSVVHYNMAADVEVEGAAARIHQSFCRSFRLDNTQSTAVRGELGRMFALRNRAVHAPGNFTHVGYRADFQVHVHPRFVDFSAPVAQVVVDFASNLVRQLLEVPRPHCSELVAWSADMRETLSKAREASNAYYPF
ncbi:MAG: hypothetical protein PHN51_09605 [Candidatus Nanopelagicales bacterium]|nr:hypothetical protein [Candidatus Nanopelagicales bacterium]MDD2819032.1 hypothetical protein [Candidatus Nanopelagicales bacterium]